MAFGNDASSPTRFLNGTTGTDPRALALQQFGGEVLAAFDLNTVFKDKVQKKDLPKGAKGWRFPKTWKATAEYHTPGQELMGNAIATTDILVTPDDLLVAHTALADLDEMLSHFEVSSQFSTELGRALARFYDKNAARQVILAARLAADGSFPGGSVISSDTLKADGSGNYSGLAWITQIRAANRAMFNKDVPEEMTRHMVVSRDVFDAIKYAQDASGRYIVLDKFINGGPDASGVTGRGDTLVIDGVEIRASRNMPNTNESADSSVYTKYRADYSKTLGVMWTDMAVASVVLRDVTLEHFRDVRRQENFMVASQLSGFGTLRGECAVEFKSAT